jgi:outer membrane protein assembly factor BamB
MCGDLEERQAENWHQWRGPLASGVAPQADPPLHWSEEENVRWKVPVAGLGNGSPVVWDDKIFLLTVIDTGRVDSSLPSPESQPDRAFGIKYPNTVHQYVVLCVDRSTGGELWRRVARERVPNEGHHNDNSFASASAVTDGGRVYAWFGAGGLYCYDMSGNQLWQRDLGDARTRLSFGEGSSPAVHADRLILVRDQEDQSRIEVFDVSKGETLWRVDRDEPSTWATPLVVEHDGTTQVITNGKNRVRSYDIRDGRLVWECGGQVANVTPSPVATADTVYCMSGYRGSALFALSLDAMGDISSSDLIRWSKSRGTPYIPSPLLYDGLLYYNQSNNNLMTCVDATTGKVLIDRQRLRGISRLYASPVGASNRVYFVGRDGATLVIEKGSEYKVLAMNPVGEPVDASPAIVGRELFLRSKSSLFCIAEH